MELFLHLWLLINPAELQKHYLHLQQLNIEKEVHENEDAVILPLSWLNNIQERGRITYLHVHPWRTKNLFSISEGKPHPEASEESEEL